MGHNIAQESDKGKKKTQGNVLFFLSVSGYLAMAQYSARQFSRCKTSLQETSPRKPCQHYRVGAMYIFTS